MQYFFGRLQPKSVKSVASYRLTESCPAGYNNLNMTFGGNRGELRMLRVLIADDESKVCQLIEKLVDWDALGM